MPYFDHFRALLGGLTPYLGRNMAKMTRFKGGKGKFDPYLDEKEGVLATFSPIFGCFWGFLTVYNPFLGPLDPYLGHKPRKPHFPV